MEKQKKKSGIVLLISSVIAKGLGVFYRIPLFALLAIESVGIYQLVFPVYAFLVSIISGGLPVSISKNVSEFLSAENIAKAEKTTDSALVFFGGIALVAVVVLLAFPAYVSEFLGNTSAKNSIITIAPAILFACIIAVLRGYFQGERKWGIVGFSFISEQLLKCVGILFLLFDTKIGVVGAILGVTIAETLTAICMLVLYFNKRQSKFSLSLPSKAFIVYCVSVSIGLIAMPLNSFIDGIAVVNLLSKQYSKSVATGLYGIMSGAVAPLISVPFVITSSFTAYLLPVLCTTKEKERRAVFNEKSKLIIFFASIFACSFFVFAPVIVKTLYPTLQNHDFKVCVNLIKTASPIVLTSTLLAIITTYLQSVNKPFLPALFLFVGVGVKTLILPFCISYFSIYGAQIANVVVYVVAFVLCCVFAVRCGFAFSLKALIVLSGGIALFFTLSFAIYSLFPSLLGCVLAFLVGASLSLAFVLSIYKVKIVQKEH